MNALEILATDHERVNQLFDRIESASDMKLKRDLFREIKQELDAHALIEETVFYPFFAHRDGFRELIEESLDEHQEVKDLLEELESITDEEDFDERIDELMGCVEHHVDEEENELFPKIEDALSEEEIEDLGERIEDAKRALPEAA